AARAAGLDAASGTYLAYCDDDDTWTPDHLSTLVGCLLEHPEVDLVYGDSEWRQEGKAPHVPYSFDYDEETLAGKNYIFAGDVVHRAEAARAAGGFEPSLEGHEDWDLWLRMSLARPPRHLARVLGTHLWHERCASNDRRPEQWERVYQAHQRRLEAKGPPGRVPFEPATWQPGARQLIWHCAVDASDGYGVVGLSLLGELQRLGIDVVMGPLASRQGYPAELGRAFRLWDGAWNKLGFYYHYLLQPARMRCEKLANYSMWESTLIPPAHVEEINSNVKLQFVPCRQNAEAFRACGVRVPIRVLPHGVDGERFPLLERGRRDLFTFGSYGGLSTRKGMDLLIRAFREEYSPDEPVRLLLKSTLAVDELLTGEPRLTVTGGRWPRERLLEFLGDLDAFVLPSRGEGFGLCGLEAMATGLPVIATNWGGPADYLDERDSFPLSYRLADPRKNELHLAGELRDRFHGLWAEPDYEHLRHLMRWLYDHPAEAASKGRQAAQRVRRDFSWVRTARQLVAGLTDLAEDRLE
ncbi:MAG: glycosyltransferase, partial [Candidatus Riflebacteria bacterium]|nr:glycosyltransferase [Candidatus Riflebacteria bacterium]